MSTEIQDQKNIDPRQKENILLSVTYLQKQVQDNRNMIQSSTVIQNKTVTFKSNTSDESQDSNMTCNDKSVFGYRLADISNVFREKKLIQNILPTKFTREFLGPTADENLVANTIKEKGSVYYLNPLTSSVALLALSPQNNIDLLFQFISR